MQKFLVEETTGKPKQTLLQSLIGLQGTNLNISFRYLFFKYNFSIDNKNQVWKIQPLIHRPQIFPQILWTDETSFISCVVRKNCRRWLQENPKYVIEVMDDIPINIRPSWWYHCDGSTIENTVEIQQRISIISTSFEIWLPRILDVLT